MSFWELPIVPVVVAAFLVSFGVAFIVYFMRPARSLGSALDEAIGIRIPYGARACFGDKERTYLAAIERHDKMTASFKLSAVEGARSPGQAIVALLDSRVVSMDQPWRAGCMILTGMTTSRLENDHIADDVAPRRTDYMIRLSTGLRE